MDDHGSVWNTQQFSQRQMVPFPTTGPMYRPMRYPSPPLQQPYQNFPFPPIHHLPPTFAPPSVPPPGYFQPFPPPQLFQNQLHSELVSVESEILQFETTDKQWVTNWLAQRNIQAPLKKTPSSSSVQLKDVHSLFLNCSSAIKELKKFHYQLSALSGSADETNWNSLLVKVYEKKAELSLLLNKVRSMDLVAIKTKLAKRAKKRSRLRRCRLKVRELKQAEQTRRKMLHQRADAWLAEMKLTVEREHREEELRREADAVLGEVTRKQTEAKRQISLLEALIKLRQVRAQRAAMHSGSRDIALDNGAKKFATVIGRLQKLWRTQLKEYAGEERGLRVMLHESAAQKSDARCKRVKSTIDLWHKAIFGENVTSVAVRRDINELITIRTEWDNYVVHFRADTPMASTIPVGWVLPQEPSSDLWRPYCVAYNKGD